MGVGMDISPLFTIEGLSLSLFFSWGMGLLMLGVWRGSAIGVVLGGGIGSYLVYLGSSETYTVIEKILIGAGLTAVGFVLYFILASLVVKIFQKKK